jgi:hypothetical protein
MLLSILTVIFVIAKILGYITWSWWLVLAPTLIHVTIALGIIGIALWTTSNRRRWY